MKILIIHNDYQQIGGEQIAVEAQIQILRNKGHEVIFYQRKNDEINCFKFFDRILFLLQTIYSFKTVRDIEKIIQATHPDIAHIHNVFPLISPSVYRVLYKNHIPIVQTVHNFRFMCPNGLFFTHGQICERCKMGNMMHAIRLKCYRNSYILSGLYAFTIWFHRKWGTLGLISRWIALNPFAKKKLIESGIAEDRKINIVQNFYDPIQMEEEESGSRMGIVYLGRLSEEKGVMDLIECAELLPEAKITIAGTGPMEADLIKASQTLQDRIRFTGYLEGNDKWHVLHQALAVIIPSRCYEQFPMTALEGMAAGKPLIVPNFGDWPNIIEDGKTGYLYERGNVVDLANKINILLRDQDLAQKMGHNARQSLETRFSSEKYHRELMECYRIIVNQNTCRID